MTFANIMKELHHWERTEGNCGGKNVNIERHLYYPDIAPGV